VIDITKEEKEFLVARFPNLCVVRTMKHRSKRHHYCCEENRKAMRALENYRAANARNA